MEKANKEGLFRQRGMLKKHIFQWKEVIIGAALNANIYANEKNTRIINNTMDSVHTFDTNSFGYDLGVGEPFKEGSPQAHLRDSLAYKLALEGNAPFGNKVASIRLEENKTLKITTKNSRIFHVKYEKLRLFDTENVYDLPFAADKVTKGFRVFDWFNVHQGTKHSVDFLEDKESNLVKNIRFYITDRVMGTHNFKDLVTESLLTADQLYNIEYSDTYSRLKALSMMKSAGIKGPLNGTDRNGRVVYRPLKIDSARREVIPVTEIKSMECGDIIIDGRTAEEIVAAGT